MRLTSLVSIQADCRSEKERQIICHKLESGRCRFCSGQNPPEPARVPRVFQQAFHLMRSGRPSPVLIDLPLDVQMGEIEFDPDTYSPSPVYKPAARVEKVERRCSEPLRFALLVIGWINRIRAQLSLRPLINFFEGGWKLSSSCGDARSGPSPAGQYPPSRGSSVRVRRRRATRFQTTLN